MFGKKVAGEARILADEGSGKMMETDSHGVDWEWHKYVLEVRPTDGQQPFRVETKTKVSIFDSPNVGDVVHVRYNPKNHDTDIVIDGDPRYDPAVKRERRKQHDAQQKANARALLAGADPSSVQAPQTAPYDDPELEELERLEAQERGGPDAPK
jgi:hypothetical protein